MQQYNRRMRGQQDPLTLDQYIDMIHGKQPARQPKFKPLEQRQNSTYRRGSGQEYPSADCTKADPSATAVPQRMEYSGERKLTGIATMHKSNMVPVFEEEGEDKNQYAKDLARMRR